MTTMDAKTLQALQHDLLQFHGTERWHRHPIVRSVTYTDGVKFFADKAGAWWLIDIFATELLGHLRTEGFLVLRCKVKDDKAELSADDGNDSPPVWTRKIEWTDCPEGEWVLFFAPGGPDNTSVILLPGEY